MSDGLPRRALILVALAALCSSVGIVIMKAVFAGESVRWTLLPFGILVYGSGLLLGIVLIGTYSPSTVYPVVVGSSLALLASIAAVVLGEPLTLGKIVGTSLVVLGVLVLLKPAEHSRAR